MDKSKQITIQEFSYMTGISPSSLRHYDKMDLLKPTYRGEENNYRLYSEDQIGQGCLIETLRNLDIPIPYIREYLNSYTPESLMNILIRKTNQIDEEMLHLMRLKHTINDLLFTVKDCAYNNNEASVRILPFDKSSLYVSNSYVHNIHAWPSTEKLNFLKKCKEKSIVATTISLSYIFPLETIKSGNYNGPARMYIKSIDGNYTVPNSLAVVSTAKYEENDLGNVFRNALEYCDNNHFHITSDFFYEMGITELTDKDRDHHSVIASALVEYENQTKKTSHLQK